MPESGGRLPADSVSSRAVSGAAAVVHGKDLAGVRPNGHGALVRFWLPSPPFHRKGGAPRSDRSLLHHASAIAWTAAKRLGGRYCSAETRRRRRRTMISGIDVLAPEIVANPALGIDQPRDRSDATSAGTRTVRSNARLQRALRSPARRIDAARRAFAAYSELPLVAYEAYAGFLGRLHRQRVGCAAKLVPTAFNAANCSRLQSSGPRAGRHCSGSRLPHPRLLFVSFEVHHNGESGQRPRSIPSAAAEAVP